MNAIEMMKELQRKINELNSLAMQEIVMPPPEYNEGPSKHYPDDRVELNMIEARDRYRARAAREAYPSLLKQIDDQAQKIFRLNQEVENQACAIRNANQIIQDQAEVINRLREQMLQAMMALRGAQ